jgi:hypothetical protein
MLTVDPPDVEAIAWLNPGDAEVVGIEDVGAKTFVVLDHVSGRATRTFYTTVPAHDGPPSGISLNCFGWSTSGDGAMGLVVTPEGWYHVHQCSTVNRVACCSCDP